MFQDYDVILRQLPPRLQGIVAVFNLKNYSQRRDNSRRKTTIKEKNTSSTLTRSPLPDVYHALVCDINLKACVFQFKTVFTQGRCLRILKSWILQVPLYGMCILKLTSGLDGFAFKTSDAVYHTSDIQRLRQSTLGRFGVQI